MPPRWNGQPAPSIMHRSMSWRLGHDALVEHQPDLLGRARRAPGRAPAPRSAVAPPLLEHRGDLRVDLGVEPSARRSRSCPPRRPGRGSPRRRTGPGTPRAASRTRAARRPGRPAASSTSGRHRQAERLQRRVGDLERRALVDRAVVTSPRKRVSSRLTTNAGASLTSTHDFFSALPTAKAVASVASSVFSARTISSSGRIATGLKKWKPTTRSGCCELGGHLGDRQRRGVGRQHALRRDDRLDLGEHLLLDLDLLEDGLDDEVGVGEGLLASRAGDQALEAVGLVGVDAALGEQLVDLAVDVADALVDALLVEVGHARPAPRAAARTAAPAGAAISPAPTTPTLVTVRASALSGAPTGRLARFCTRSKA